MPTLAIFLHELAATGVARNALTIGKHMRAAGWRVTIITVRPGGALAGLLDGLDHVVLGRLGLPRKAELLARVPALRAAIDAIAPDVLLSAGNHAHLAMVLATYKPTRARVVFRVSNDLLHGERTATLSSMLSLRRNTARIMVRRAWRLILVSPHLRGDPVLQPAVESGRARVIANGVDVALVRERSLEPCGHPWTGEAVPIVLAVGRLERQKNFAGLLRAFALARAQRPLRLMIVGGGAKRKRAALERLAASLGIADDIAWVGKVANPFPYYRAASVLALPSFWEGSSNVLLEAIACGVPVVVSPQAGNAREILDGGRYGILADPYDPNAIARGLGAQLDPVTRVTPGDRALAYDLPGVLMSYQALFEEALAGHQAEDESRRACA